MRENPKNVETLEDQVQEADWMQEEDCGGYKQMWAKDNILKSDKY